MNEITWIPGGLIGSIGEEAGAVLALRKGGDEALFASRDKKPCRWVAITEFSVDPDTIALVEDEYEEEEEAASPPPRAPFPTVKRRE
jgi:hypothetical protein